MEWKNVYEKIVWKDKLVLDAPNFEELWERAFEAWKEYVTVKEQTSRKMAAFDPKKKKEKVEKQEKVEVVKAEVEVEEPKEKNKETESSEVRSATSSEAEPDAEKD